MHARAGPQVQRPHNHSARLSASVPYRRAVVPSGPRLGGRPAAAFAVAAYAAETNADGAGASAKTPWHEKNVEGWTHVGSAGDLARAAHAARRSGRRVLALELFAPSCSACKSSWPALSRLARDAALAPDVFFAKISVDGPDARRLLKEQGVTGIPWMLVLDVGEPGAAAPPPSEAAEAAGLFKQLGAAWLKRQFGGGGGGKGGGGKSAGSAASELPVAAAAAGGGGGGEAAGGGPELRVLEAAGATLVLGQGASFKKIAVLRSNLAAVPALVKGGRAVVVDPNGIVVVAAAPPP